MSERAIDLFLKKVDSHIQNQLLPEDRLEAQQAENEYKIFLKGRDDRKAWFKTFKKIVIKVPPDVYERLKERASKDDHFNTVSKQASILCEAGLESVPEEPQ